MFWQIKLPKTINITTENMPAALHACCFIATCMGSSGKPFASIAKARPAMPSDAVQPHLTPSMLSVAAVTVHYSAHSSATLKYDFSKKWV